MQNQHQNVNGWNDIGYNFLISSDGTVFEGRNFLVGGSHTKSFNDIAYGLNFIGDFVTKVPTPEAIASFKLLVSCGIENGFISEDFQLFGHRQNWVSKTECPGDQLFALLHDFTGYSYGRQMTDS